MWAPVSQTGSGLGGGATDTAHLTLRSAFEAHRSCRQCVVAFFVDIQTAFVAVQRALLFSNPESDEAFLCALRDLGLADDDVQQLYLEAIAAARATSGFSNNHDEAFLVAMHTWTWVSGNGISEVLHTRRGTLAGMALADVRQPHEVA